MAMTMAIKVEATVLGQFMVLALVGLVDQGMVLSKVDMVLAKSTVSVPVMETNR